ncbi:hypothetical protein GCM10023320_55700 [Pseudonocardia adelaidensis]|uniref:Uncharacterized protein n=1 Tax=Pseudonocardia adelaidensis TaxID=648754 RepID=A0ABP9NQR8_9PSEU
MLQHAYPLTTSGPQGDDGQPRDCVVVTVLGDEWKVVRDRGGGDPRAVRGERPAGTTHRHPQLRPRIGHAVVDRERIESHRTLQGAESGGSLIEVGGGENAEEQLADRHHRQPEGALRRADTAQLDPDEEGGIGQPS